VAGDRDQHRSAGGPCIVRALADVVSHRQYELGSVDDSLPPTVNGSRFFSSAFSLA
jgi:hypothetical protein